MAAIVTLRIGRLDVDAAEVARLSSLIDEAERARAARFRFDRDRRRFLVRRGRLREWLGACVGERPERLAFVEGAYGKPVLAGLPGAPHFSASHSGELMMLAIADVEIGCDIERMDPALEWEPLAAGEFSTNESAALRALPQEAGRRAFFDCWTRKEAIVKGLGLGLSRPLDSFDVSVGRERMVRTTEPGWALWDSPPGPGHAGAIAVQAMDGIEIRLIP